MWFLAFTKARIEKNLIRLIITCEVLVCTILLVCALDVRRTHSREPIIYVYRWFVLAAVETSLALVLIAWYHNITGDIKLKK